MNFHSTDYMRYTYPTVNLESIICIKEIGNVAAVADQLLNYPLFPEVKLDSPAAPAS